MSEAELEQDGGAVEDGAPEGAPETTGSTDQDRQPQEDKRSTPVNLDDLPEFRKWKSSTDRNMAEVNRRLQQAEQARQAAEQRWQQAQMQGMNEAEQLAFQNQILQQQLQEINQIRQYEYFEYQRTQDLMKIANKLGVPLDELQENLPQGADSFVAWEVATDLANKRQTSRTKDARRNDPVRQEARSNVDLGQGKPSVAMNEYQRMKQRALEEYDASALIDSWGAAAQAGVDLQD